MITKVLYKEVNERFSEIYLEDLDKYIFVETDTRLIDETLESRINDIKDGWSYIDGEHLLLVVKLVLQNKPDDIDDDDWLDEVENSKNTYSFKVL
jgi:hypothetical protein